MLYSLVIPKTLSDYSEVRILQWHFEVGNSFASGELLLEIETQKAVVEIRAEQSGILRAINGEEGQWIKLDQDKSLAIFSDDTAPLPVSLPQTLPPIKVEITIL
jgi:pyruvate/2-oxoglutarate dehydrogenase complex dihydrolipoamide acyltransferase (E2) component